MFESSIVANTFPSAIIYTILERAKNFPIYFDYKWIIDKN